jgi:homocitrate synthase
LSLAETSARSPEGVKAKYNLHALRDLENLVADAVQISIPFNKCALATDLVQH